MSSISLKRPVAVRFAYILLLPVSISSRLLVWTPDRAGEQTLYPAPPRPLDPRSESRCR
jgi:hypothetical protein